jgi:glycosyltransferase involved in cell wall biosynthesis
MPKLLFITYYFPPLRQVACLRTSNIVKHLKNQGWEISVITPSPDLWNDDSKDEHDEKLSGMGVKLLYTQCRRKLLLPHRQVQLHSFWTTFIGKKLRSLIRSTARAMRVDKMSGWYPQVKKAVLAIKPGDFDIVMASGNPYGAFQCAVDIAKQIKCPVVFDYRDLWSGNPHMRASKKFRDFNKERELLNKCDAVTVVSPSMKQSMEEMFGIGNKVHIIPNGYDIDEYTHVKATEFDHIAIVYAGQFIAPNSTPEPIMKAMDLLNNDDTLPTWKFHYMGPSGRAINDQIKQYGLKNHYIYHGNIPREECLKNIKGASLSIVITSVKKEASLAEKGIITGKVFEPMALEIPILAIAPEGSDVERVIKGSGWMFSSDQVKEIAQIMRSIIKQESKFEASDELYNWCNISAQLSRDLLKLTHQ